MTNNIVNELIVKTYKELVNYKMPQVKSRMWKSTNGYIFLVVWSNSSLLRILAAKWFDWQKGLKDFKGNYGNLRETRGMGYVNRLEAQLLDCLRSVVANIEEGFARPTTDEYLKFLGYSQASLKEAKGDIQRLLQDGFIRSVQGSSLQDMGIDLKDWQEALKESVISKPLKSSKILQSPLKSYKGEYRNLEEFKFNYYPVDSLDSSKLTYEILIELVNKTDWNLRKLVESLEKKQNQEHRYYQVEKARIRGAARGRQRILEEVEFINSNRHL